MFKILERFERGADDDPDRGLDEIGGDEGRGQEGGNGIGANKLEDLYRGLIASETGTDGQEADEEEDTDNEEDEEAREELVRKLEGVDLGEHVFATTSPLKRKRPNANAHLRPSAFSLYDFVRLAGSARPVRPSPRESPEKVCRGFAVGKRSSEAGTGCRGRRNARGRG